MSVLRQRVDLSWLRGHTYLFSVILTTHLVASLAYCQSPYPDLHVPGIHVEVKNAVNQYVGDLRITGYVRNQGAEFKYNGKVLLYRGNQLLTTMPFGKIPIGSGVNIVYDIGESCSNGPSALPGYLVRIEYDSGIQAPEKEIDRYFDNNELTVDPIVICAKIKDAFIPMYRTNLLACVNQYRQANGSPPLALDPCFNTAAQGHHDWMNGPGLYSHIGKNNSSPLDRCMAAGCNCTSSHVENIFSGGTNWKEPCDAWMNSEGHRRNMLDPSYTRAGIGCGYTRMTMVFDK
jgi:hypothetical protein